MTVAEELASLRRRGTVKAHATNLTEKTACGEGLALSTPEAEAAALRAGREGDRLGRSRASEILRSGGSAGGYSQEMEHTLNQTGKKRQDWERKEEARRTLAVGVGRIGSGSPTKAAPHQSIANKKTNGESTASEANEKEEEPKEAAKEENPSAGKEISAPVEKKDPVSTAVDPDETANGDIPEEEEVEGYSIPDPGTTVDVMQHNTGHPEEEGERQVINRSEKKARKLMTRLGMRPVPHIVRVTLKAGGGRGYFFIERPDVFVGAGGGKGETYVIFGEAKQGGGGIGGERLSASQAAQAQAAMAQKQAATTAAANDAASKRSAMLSVQGQGVVPDLKEERSSAVTGDEEGIEAKDIDLVMGQASCTRAKAMAALRENDGDLVNAIMSLTT